MDRDNVQVFSPEGTYLRTISEHGTGPGQLLEPRYITTDIDGNVWVADYGNNRVQAFTTEGELIKAWGDFGSRAWAFSQPVRREH